jgi:hypothetical protein
VADGRGLGGVRRGHVPSAVRETLRHRRTRALLLSEMAMSYLGSSRTSTSIHRQVRTGVLASVACGVRSVIATPSTGRSAGRSPGRRGRVKTPARPPSLARRAQGSRERLLGLVAASCGAFWPPPKSHDSSSSRPWRECTMLACGDIASVTGNRWASTCLTFPQCQANTAQLLEVIAGRPLFGYCLPGFGLAGFGSSGRWAKPRARSGTLTTRCGVWFLV